MITTVARQSAVELRAGASHANRRRTRKLREEAAHRVAPTESVSPTAPPLVMVFRARDGRIGHARCGWPLQYHGRRAGLELDFYCQGCVEHVTLPECVLSRIPLRDLTADDE